MTCGRLLGKLLYTLEDADPSSDLAPALGLVVDGAPVARSPSWGVARAHPWSRAYAGPTPGLEHLACGLLSRGVVTRERIGL